VLKQLTFTYVDHMDQVLNVALKREIRPERADVRKPVGRANRRAREGVAAAPQ